MCALQVITYLNDEINKWQMGLTGTTGTAVPAYRKYDNKYDSKYENKYENNDVRDYTKNIDYDYENYEGEYGDKIPYKKDATVSFPDTPTFKDSNTLIQVPKNSDYYSKELSAVPSKMTDVNVISYSPDNVRNKLIQGNNQKNKDENISNDFISVGFEGKVNYNSNNNNSNTNENKSDKDYNNVENQNNYDNQNQFDSQKFNQNAEIGKESSRDILLRGIQNLGLGSSFGSLEGLGLDLSLGKEMNENFISVFKDTVNGRITPESMSRRSVNNNSNIDSRVRPRAQVKSHQSNLAYTTTGSGVRGGSGSGSGDKRDQRGYPGSGTGAGTVRGSGQRESISSPSHTTTLGTETAEYSHSSAQ